MRLSVSQSLLLPFVLLSGFAPASTSASNTIPTFGQNYAVLNLDLINGVVSPLAETSEGQAWINNTSTWIDAVHVQSPRPLTIYTRIYYSSPLAPELSPDIPFYKAAAAFGNITESDPVTQIYLAFAPAETDVVLRKSRYYAGDGNSLEEILRTQRVDTVVLSGIRSSGVILSTAYRLFDLDYNVYVISDTTIEPGAPDIQSTIMEGILPGLPVTVLTLEQALRTLRNSGPAVW
ncbi:cysteine hydrolase [Aspergillus mulundensis]|uniref:Isochorismatase-like domain-containing protein n=1 Tax=Aspergillus mulundensis TaxID=1810919 RepID=A0A3D8QJ27_9EURO|nr:Uncharacterized protein DSM5745_10498 [Aspergillus mulundensis]RDW61826.1 Uncharacterized protein DSM5745_10498 [Aspergillus mulundensis]